MSNKSYGLGFERKAKEMLYKEGALFVNRCRGSFGVFDVIAYFEDFCLLVSVKSTKQRYFAINVEKEKLRNTKVPPYCRKALWIWWSPNKLRKQKGWEKVIIE